MSEWIQLLLAISFICLGLFHAHEGFHIEKTGLSKITSLIAGYFLTILGVVMIAVLA